MKRSKKGFTLLEITISLLLLAIGIIGFLHLVGVGLQSSKRAGDITEATLLAQRQMAEIQADRSSLQVETGSDFSGVQYEIKMSGLDDNLYFVKVEALDDDGKVAATLVTYLYKPD